MCKICNNPIFCYCGQNAEKPNEVSESTLNDVLCADCKLKSAMDDFGKRLLENQEPLPPEFQKVIDDNYLELLTGT